MIAHKTFTEATIGLTGKRTLMNREKLREKAEEFINNEINEEDVINITETAITISMLFSVTVWYRKR
jgi:hypothetical protein